MESGFHVVLDTSFFHFLDHVPANVLDIAKEAMLKYGYIPVVLDVVLEEYSTKATLIEKTFDIQPSNDLSITKYERINRGLREKAFTYGEKGDYLFIAYADRLAQEKKSVIIVSNDDGIKTFVKYALSSEYVMITGTTSFLKYLAAILDDKNKKQALLTAEKKLTRSYNQYRYSGGRKPVKPTAIERFMQDQSRIITIVKTSVQDTQVKRKTPESIGQLREILQAYFQNNKELDELSFPSTYKELKMHLREYENSLLIGSFTRTTKLIQQIVTWFQEHKYYREFPEFQALLLPSLIELNRRFTVYLDEQGYHDQVKHLLVSINQLHWIYGEPPDELFQYQSNLVSFIFGDFHQVYYDTPNHESFLDILPKLPLQTLFELESICILAGNVILEDRIKNVIREKTNTKFSNLMKKHILNKEVGLDKKFKIANTPFEDILLVTRIEQRSQYMDVTVHSIAGYITLRLDKPSFEALNRCREGDLLQVNQARVISVKDARRPSQAIIELQDTDIIKLPRSSLLELTRRITDLLNEEIE